MGEFDVRKWNNARRLAAVNENKHSAEKDAPSDEERYFDSMLEAIRELNLDEDLFSTLKGQRNNILRKMLSMKMDASFNSFGMSEGAMDRDQIAQSEFGMDYEQLGRGEKEWVDDEYEKDTHHK